MVKSVVVQPIAAPPLLKLVAPKNIFAMFVTLLTSHALKSWLRLVLPLNNPFMLVMLDTLQVEISALESAAP